MKKDNKFEVVDLLNKLSRLAKEIEEIVADIDNGLSYGGVGLMLEETNASLVDIASEIKKTTSQIKKKITKK